MICLTKNARVTLMTSYHNSVGSHTKGTPLTDYKCQHYTAECIRRSVHELKKLQLQLLTGLELVKSTTTLQLKCNLIPTQTRLSRSRFPNLFLSIGSRIINSLIYSFFIYLFIFTFLNQLLRVRTVPKGIN